MTIARQGCRDQKLHSEMAEQELHRSEIDKESTASATLGLQG